jgi:putative transcriptional regulator
MIRIRIKDVAEAKDFKNAHRLQLAAELSPHVAQRLWRGEVEKISMETLNRICRALDCQPGDLFVYEPDAVGETGRESEGVEEPQPAG